jgi:hypothetical protein
MLVLRLTSPDYVLGMTSDDGFEIGVVRADTLQLLAAAAVLGGLNGVAYAALRDWIPRAIRLPLWTLLVAALGGATIVHEDGLDFTMIEPVELAIVLFILLPASAAALAVALVERWADQPPFHERRLSVTVGLCAAMGSLALLPAAIVGALAFATRRLDVSVLVGRVARFVVPAVLIAWALYAGFDPIEEIARLT